MYGHFGLLLENGLGLKQDESKVTRNVTFSSEICDERVGEMGENRFWFWDFQWFWHGIMTHDFGGILTHISFGIITRLFAWDYGP